MQMQRKNSRNLVSLVERKSVIEGDQPDDGTCTNVETVETVVHKKEEKEKDRALEVRVGDKKTVSEKATDDGIYSHETSQLKIPDQCIESVSVKRGERKIIRCRVCFENEIVVRRFCYQNRVPAICTTRGTESRSGILSSHLEIAAHKESVKASRLTLPSTAEK